MNSIVFLHGMGQNASSWRDAASNLKSVAMVKCPELYAVNSECGISYDGIYDAFEKDVVARCEPVVLCGLSLGGMIALRFTSNHPDLVKGLILIGTQYKSPKILLGIQNFIFRFLPEKAFVDTGLSKSKFIHLSKSMSGIDYSNVLAKITCPTIVICGERDKANKSAANKMARVIRNCEYREIAGAGHEVNVEKANELATLILVSLKSFNSY